MCACVLSHLTIFATVCQLDVMFDSGRDLARSDISVFSRHLFYSHFDTQRFLALLKWFYPAFVCLSKKHTDPVWILSSIFAVSLFHINVRKHTPRSHNQDHILKHCLLDRRTVCAVVLIAVISGPIPVQEFRYGLNCSCLQCKCIYNSHQEINESALRAHITIQNFPQSVRALAQNTALSMKWTLLAPSPN